MCIINKTRAVFLASFLLNLSAFGQWLPINSGTLNNLNAVYLLNSGVAFAVGDAGTILKSTDAGMTWIGLTSGTTKALDDLYFFSDNEGVTVGEGGLILRTTDGGASWQSVVSGVRDTLESISFNGVNGICGGTSQSIIYSSNSGASWNVSQKGFFGGGFPGAYMLNATTGFVAGENSIFQPFVGATTDGGVHWTFYNFYFDGNEGSCDDIFFFDANSGLVSGVVWNGQGAIARTTNGGVDWTTSLYDHGLRGIDFPKPDAGFVVGWLGTILKSTDMGTTWSTQTSGTSADLFDVHFASDALTGIVVGASGTILRTTNGGNESGFTFDSAFSEKGPWDIDLPLDGTGIEDRSGGPDKLYSIHFAFSNGLTSVASAITSCGTVDSLIVSNRDPNQAVVNLTRVTCNESEITVTLNGIVDDQGNTLPSVSLTFGLLIGDVSGDGMVDHKDSRIVKKNLGQPVNQNNLRADVSDAGHQYINTADLMLVKRQFGTHL